MTDQTSDPRDFARLATEMVIATQTATLRLLGAELHGLAQMIPGAVPVHDEPSPTDDEVERGFENMPV